MNIHALSLAALMAVACFVSSSRSAMAAFTVFGSGEAQSCAQAARDMEKGVAPTAQSLVPCDSAIENESLSMRDRAGTYINRGVLYLARGGYQQAKADFDSAVALMPALGEAYTNRGAALLALQLYTSAIADIDRGLALNPSEPEKAFFNRGLAEEALDNIPAAYRDYARAAELKPGWALPLNELSRFTVSPRRS
jgi:tetratricopeptide (TPR) repeat protein